MAHGVARGTDAHGLAVDLIRAGGKGVDAEQGAAQLALALALQPADAYDAARGHLKIHVPYRGAHAGPA